MRTGILAVLALCAGASAVCAAAEPDGVVLDGNSPWRYWRAFRHSEVRTADGKLEYKIAYWGMKPAPTTAWFGLPPADWTAPEFDDFAWARTRVPLWREGIWNHTPITADTALVALRGKFEVRDPAQVRELQLSLVYYGGAVAYLNGKEVARGHLPADKPGPETSAEDYPQEAFFTPDGKPLELSDKKNADRLALRERRLAGVKIPAAALRKGVNVLAVEVHRAPIPEAIFKTKGVPGWPPVEPLSVTLSASPAGSATPNRVRPEGIQVWTCIPSETVTAFDFADPCEPPAPISVPAARNGVFSGRLLVSSGGPIRGLKVTVSDLVQADGGGKIPAAAVRVRYAEPGDRAKSARMPPYRFDGLLDVIPAEVPVAKAAFPAGANGTNWLSPPDRKGVTAGATASLWLTVRVPKDAKPGKYQGTVSVSAEGLKPTSLPVRLGVSAWTVPDPKDFRVVSFGQLSPESVAKHYEVPLWSEKHLELVGKSMALMAELNSRRVDATMAIDFFGLAGNPESMVRWIKQPESPAGAPAREGGSPSTGSGPAGYKYDFSVFDKYLDLAAKTIGKPALLRINCWNEVGLQDGKPITAVVDAGGKVIGKPQANFRVSVLDESTGKLSEMEQPTPGTEESLAFWKPVLGEMRKRIEARGWWDVTAMGWNSYCHPPIPHIVSQCRKIWPDGVWSYTAHNGTLGAKWKGLEPGSEMPVRYADSLWTHGTPTARGYQALLKPRPGYCCFTYRGHRDLEELAICRNMAEWEISAGHDGYCDFGVDFFPVKKPGGNGYYIVGNGRGTGGPTDGTLAWLAPGPAGPIATERFEMLREGIETAEAILFLERALQEKKVPGDLAQKVNRYLDERGEPFVKGGDFWWGWVNTAFDADQKLLELAGEVAAALGGK